MNTPPNIVGENALTIIWEGKQHTLTSQCPNFKTVKKLILKAKFGDELTEALCIKKSFEKQSEGNVTISGNTVLYKGQAVHNSAAKKLIHLLEIGSTDLKPGMRFLDKLMENPSYNSREQLYKFLEHKNMPITEQGNIIGYKGVRDDYKDIYSGTFDNSPGQILEMKRTEVDDSVDHGCSAGFHIGSHDYADSWGRNGKLMKVEFSPRDAVSVPHCSEYQKLRVCRYHVLEEIHDRKPVADGLHGHDNQAPKKWNKTCRKLVKWLQKKYRKGITVTLSECIERYQPTINTPEDIDHAICSTGHECDIQWDDQLNEYVVFAWKPENTNQSFTTGPINWVN